MQKDIAELDKIKHRAVRLCDPMITFQDLSQRRFRANMCERYKILDHLYRLKPEHLVLITYAATASSYQNSGLVRLYERITSLIEWSTRGINWSIKQ